VSSQTRFDRLREICEKFNVAILYVFGSRAEEVKKWMREEIESLSPGSSDVDVGVKPMPGFHLTVRDKVRLAIALEDLLDVERVDLIVLPEASPFLAANIVRGERLYAENEDMADEYDLYILRRAGDLAPLERERIELILGVKA
jgi:predicted nucleotidyltransferase